MTLASIRTVNNNDRKMNVFDIEECKKERDKIRQKNIANSPELRNYFRNFNIKYANLLIITLEK